MHCKFSEWKYQIRVNQTNKSKLKNLCNKYIKLIETSENYHMLWFLNHNLARVYSMEDDPINSLKYANLALDYLSKHSNIKFKDYYLTTWMRAKCYISLNEFDVSLKLLGQCSNYFKTIGDKNNWYAVMWNIVYITNNYKTCEKLIKILKSEEITEDMTTYINKDYLLKEFTILLGRCYIENSQIEKFYNLVNNSDKKLKNNFRKIFKENLIS